MKLLEQMHRLLAKAAAEGATPLRWDIRQEGLAEIEEAASSNGLLAWDVEGRGNRKILGLPYQVTTPPNGLGVVLISADMG